MVVWRDCSKDRASVVNSLLRNSQLFEARPVSRAARESTRRTDVSRFWPVG